MAQGSGSTRRGKAGDKTRTKARGTGKGRADSANPALDRARRAFLRRQRRRRWLTWRYVVAAVAAVSLLAFGIYAVYFSSWTRAEGVVVLGTDLLSTEQVLEAAEVPTGGALARVDLDPIAKRVGSLAAVRSVDVSRKWPHDVRIEVVERKAVAVLDQGRREMALDADGTAFPAPPRALEGLPRVRVGAGADRNALSEGAAVVASLDREVAALVEYASIRTVDEIMLHLEDGRLVRWGSAGQSEEKAAVLLKLLAVEATTYDVSVPGAPTTR
ncbi:FtsQ-type POTRA domain-containing protein [Nocardioides sp. zg-536]|uniref:FtsQ-type POTRA domain-containing protein n=1 Tax=Nocardioides faecalis TaxID=2803858 RepID=A0A939BWD9_9ACTN|nr:FtsQ-type POTRA domain-containing protein [Nocardioides faecalis]MBM9460482.1 FtsQ-type POTRA domain-containing protein [Nocardioides faecalis]QVI57581.1 FtsQ-type POTRA domain-containing protein [Nocardioides faecalis]